MVGLWRRTSARAEQGTTEPHNTRTSEPFAVIHGFITATSTPDCEGVTVSRREHGAHEALFASDEYCYGDTLLARFVIHRLELKRADRCTECSVQRKMHRALEGWVLA